MGGFVRAISRAVFGSPKTQVVQQPVQVQQPAQTVSDAQMAKDASMTKAKLMGSGYGGTTIMSSASGVEEEANVGKTILGGGSKKKIKA